MIVNIAPGINHKKQNYTKTKLLLRTYVYSVYDILRVKFLTYRKRNMSSLQRTIG